MVAFPRRGCGESGRPKHADDTATLAEDARTQTDSLGIERAVPARHVVSGDALTELAVRHPERVAGLVDMDAACDRSHTTRRPVRLTLPGQLPPAPPRPSGRDRPSAASARELLRRLCGVGWPPAGVVATRT